MKLFKRMLSVLCVCLLVVITVPVVPAFAADSSDLFALSYENAFDVGFDSSAFQQVFPYDLEHSQKYFDLAMTYKDSSTWSISNVVQRQALENAEHFVITADINNNVLSLSIFVLAFTDKVLVNDVCLVRNQNNTSLFWDADKLDGYNSNNDYLSVMQYTARFNLSDNSQTLNWSFSSGFNTANYRYNRNIGGNVICSSVPVFHYYNNESQYIDESVLFDLGGINSFTDLRGSGGAGTDNRFGFDVFQTSVNNLGSNGWGVHNGYRIKNNIPNTTIASYDLNYHITWQISAGVTSERGLTENKTFTYEVNEVRKGSPSGSGFEDFELNDALNDEDKTIFSLILNSSTDNSSTIGSNIIKTGVSIGSLFLGPYREPVGLVGNWLGSLPSSFDEDSDLYLQGITCYIECYPSTSKMEGVLSATSTNLFTGASTSFLYPPVLDGSDDEPVLEKKPSTLDNVKTYDDGSHSYYPSSANGGNSNSSSSATGGTANAWINMPETITVMLQGAASGGGSNSGHCNVTVLDDDVSKDELLEVLASGYGLLDDVATDERSDGFLNMLRHFYGAIDPRLGTIMMFGVGTSISVLIIRNILRH